MFSGTDGRALIVCIFFLIPFTGLYVSLGGLWGVLWTDLFQFVLKMGIVIAVAYYAVAAAGGIAPMMEKISAMRASNGGSDPLAFLPDFSKGFSSEALWTLPVLTFAVYLGVQWWAFWYPGAEPGGGGYIAQRIFSARNEREGLLAVLWFNVAHYALRPWPWIFTALAAIVLYPGLAKPESSYMMIVNQYVPHPCAGLFCGISGGVHVHHRHAAQLGHIVPGGGFLPAVRQSAGQRAALRAHVANRYGDAGNRHRLHFRTTGVDSFRMASGAGTWSGNRQRLSAALVLVADQCVERNFVHGYGDGDDIGAALDRLWLSVVGRPEPFSGSSTVIFAKTTLTTTSVTTVVWIVVTLFTSPEPEAILLAFYRKVRPQVTGWRVIAGLAPEVRPTHDLGRNLWCWILGCVMTYSALFGVGKLLLRNSGLGTLLVLLALACAGLMWRELYRVADNETNQEVI